MRIRNTLVSVALILVTAIGIGMIPMAGIQSGAAAKPKTVKSLAVSKTRLSLDEGSSISVNAKVRAIKKTSGKNLKVTVKSSDKTVAAVKVVKSPLSKKTKSAATTFKITAKKAGTATITVTTSSLNKKKKAISKKIKVSVNSKAPVETPTPTPTATPEPTKAPTATPKPTEKPAEPRYYDVAAWIEGSEYGSGIIATFEGTKSERAAWREKIKKQIEKEYGEDARVDIHFSGHRL